MKFISIFAASHINHVLSKGNTKEKYIEIYYRGNICFSSRFVLEIHSHGKFPCPSHECWDFDSLLGQCILKDDSRCFDVFCHHDKMIVYFKSSLLNLIDGDETQVEISDTA